jgi:phage N-6-adenine-methyltransferase
LHYHKQGATPIWETPQPFFDRLHTEFAFDLDVCALPINAKCPRFFTPEIDGLAQEWTGVCWMNPPYGREIREWIRKAYESAQSGATVVCLIPARTDSAWWHTYVWDVSLNAPRTGVGLRLVKGRLKFGGSKDNAPFPSAVVVFRPPHGSAEVG